MTAAIDIEQAARPEQSRALYPHTDGFVERGGVRLFYEVYGDGEPTLVLLPTWSIVHSRHWKAQIPYLARHARVVTFDGRGNGRSDRPRGADAYVVEEFALDTLAVMDATATDRAVLVALSCGARWATLLAAEHPERVDAVACVAPAAKLAPGHAARAIVDRFDEDLVTDQGWAKQNRRYFRRDYRGFLEFFFAEMFSEPHSTKQIEDCVGWGLDTDAETLADTVEGEFRPTKVPLAELCARVRCPVLVIHGDEDRIRPHAQGAALAETTGGRLVTLGGSGHGPHVRDPVRVNLLLREFALPPAPPPRAWRRGLARGRRRALYVSSPIGLGHARRDLAIARELRRLHPDLEIDWLAQHPVTAVLEAEGERVNPASALLAGESPHIQREASGHELHVFEAIRRMDEILVANFMVFCDLVRDEHYDLWIGDEAWELDHFLHENPELKTAAYAWLTDFVGWLPLPEGGEREELVTADYNAEMIEHIDRYPRVRDRAIFVGEPDDIVPHDFGPGLPRIRDWTEEHFTFAGYVSGFEPDAVADREALRAELGYRPGERVCVVTVGGSGVGEDLLRRVVAAYPAARDLVAGLRMVVVAGPRIDPATLPRLEGVEVHAYVHGLYRHLAACDLAVVQGGLTTTMELVASGRPFLYFPLRRHFEQQVHVPHRLDRHRAGRRMEYEAAGPEEIAAAIAAEIGRDTDYLPVAPDGAARAARQLAELL